MKNTVVTPLDERPASAPVAVSDRLWQDVAEALSSAETLDSRPAELAAAPVEAAAEPGLLARLLDGVHDMMVALKLSFTYSPTANLWADPLFLLRPMQFTGTHQARCCHDGPADLS